METEMGIQDGLLFNHHVATTALVVLIATTTTTFRKLPSTGNTNLVIRLRLLEQPIRYLERSVRQLFLIDEPQLDKPTSKPDHNHIKTMPRQRHPKWKLPNNKG
jgi:hypothetical protein